MRTTVTLDPDTESLVRHRMAARGVSFKQALNDAIRAGVGPSPRGETRTLTRAMGRPSVPVERALQLAGELEDEEIVRRMRTGK